MGPLVQYQLEDSIATITMDDGKVNALSLPLLAEIDLALDQAAADRAVIVLTGRPGVFSAGFDLAALRAGGPGSFTLLRAGFELAARMLSFPMPVLIACSGHAVAMGAFLLLSGDYRVGGSGPCKITANEVAIGLTMPLTAIEICRQRLAAGLLDKVVPDAELASTARAAATELAKLDLTAHWATKLRARDHALTAIRAAIEADDAAVRSLA
jgi:enoyl-CoA hydratase